MNTVKLKCLNNKIGESQTYFSYSGELKEDIPNGFGTGIFETFKYCGEWKNGYQNGKGIKTFIDTKTKLQVRYDSCFKGVFAHGYGKFFIDNKIIYKGSFFNNKYTGIGTLYHFNGKIKYKGSFLEGKYKGYGCLYNNTDEKIYEGEFSNNLKNGKGISYDPILLTQIYNGNWLNDKYEGYGCLKIDTTQYTGNFINGEKNGKGKLIDTHSEYIGNFKNDMKNDKGILTIPNKYKYNGEFYNDEITGYGIIIYNNKDYFEGNFLKGKKNGTGSITIYKSKNQYKCEWFQDLKNGNGILIDSSGTKFNCKWSSGTLLNKKRISENIDLNIPFEFKCPITLEIMKNPVIASDGHSYDRTSLEILFSSKLLTYSPIDRTLLNKKIIIINYNLKNIIEDFISNNPSYI